jgi:hypothetical protein
MREGPMWRRFNPVLADRFRYRADGWPLCPSCGADELMSGKIPARPSDELQCLACLWRGTVPVRQTGVRRE